MRTPSTALALGRLGVRLVTLLGQTVSAASPPASAPAGGDGAGPTEVLVHGARLPSRDAGSDRIQAQDVRDVPGTFGEPLQTIASLPGVSPMASGLPYFYVRGAPPADTGYFIDGVPVPSLFHIGPGPSVIPPPLLDRIDFFPSNAPARYGRFIGGVIAGEVAPASPVARGEGSIRLFDASAFVETPLDDGKSSALVAGRYGYPNLLLSIFAPNLSLEYGDYTARFTRSLSGSDTVSVLALGAHDREEDSSQNLVPVSSQFHRIDVRYDHRWKGGSVRVATTFGYDQGSDVEASSPGETATAVSGRLRGELEQRFGDRVRVSAGVDANVTQAAFDVAGHPIISSSLSEVAGAYVDVRVRPMPWLEIAPGARVDVYRWSETSQWAQTSAGAVDPKLTARIGLSPDLTWTSTFGIADEAPTYVLPVPGLEIDPSHGLQRSYQMSEGLDLLLPLATRARVTAFYSSVHNVNDFVSDCGTFAQACNVVDRVDGRTYGLEVMIERALSERLGGWVSYTLSRAERHLGDVSYLSPFDRTHVLSAVLRYDFGRGVSAGMRATYYTGRPDFPTFAYGSATTFSAGPGQIAQHRLPPFYRLDARVDKRWNLGRGRWVSAGAEFFDVTLSKETIDFRCQLLTGQCSAQAIGPVALPSVGVEGGF